MEDRHTLFSPQLSNDIVIDHLYKLPHSDIFLCILMIEACAINRLLSINLMRVLVTIWKTAKLVNGQNIVT